MNLRIKQKKWIYNKLIPGIIFSGIILALLINGQWNRYQLRTYPRYTIGRTIKTYWTYGSGNQLEYEFKVKNKYYKNSDRYNDKSKVPGGRYYVKFCFKDPSICEIMQDHLVPDTITIVPTNGWYTIPH